MATTRPTVFVSHSTADDGFVRELSRALENLQQPVWIDSREVRGGDLLWPKIQAAIREAGALAVVISPTALQSEWVADELRYAIKLQKKRRKAGQDFPVIPLSLDGARLGFAVRLFGAEPAYIAVSTRPGGLDEALRKILEALGLRLPAELPPTDQPSAQPVEELVLELSQLGFAEHDGIRRASVRARLRYEPATPGKREVQSTALWTFTAPLGPIEAEELHWYLEQYAIWPSGVFHDRAEKVKQALATWGQFLHQAALPAGLTGNVLQAWAAVAADAQRRFSVYLEEGLDQNASEDERKVAREAATALLSLPWELMHDGGRFLFQGARPVRVRRRLPNTRVLDVAVVAPPIRILLVTARPEDDACLYIDHRTSAKPLVQAMEHLGGLVRLSLLDPPTFPALLGELDRARQAGRPYHVVHFDGHGVYSRTEGLGGLCFEHPEDVNRLVERRHKTVFTDRLGPALADYRIPLVFLEACQTAQAEDAAGSVASALLQAGVASVVAMSHSVLVETSWRFVEEFYQALADGARVGQAMLAGQRRLHDDTFRLHIFGAGELHLQDWFVPVLFQEKEDPQLFHRLPSRAAASITEELRRARYGKLPDEPATGFIGRSRELLALQRLLRPQHSVGRIGNPSYSATKLPRWAVVRGNGGEGKTTLAVELARWLVRSQQMDRAAFVSVEIDTNAAAVVNALGQQLVANHQLATTDNVDAAVQQVERALEEQSTVLVVDNMESILRPPYAAEDEALAANAADDLREILDLCRRLCRVGSTRIVFTSREALPEPFADRRHRIELERLAKDDAVKLVERALQQSGVGGRIQDAIREAIEDLVAAVQGHARTLALLAQPLRELGVERTRQSLVSLMADMPRRFPKSREQSLFASVELSLQRLSAENRERVGMLGVFHGELDLDVLRMMMNWQQNDVATLAIELI
jgi:CHAT domain-containing protein/TIR domain-containing protein/AAA domain-containing protein